MEGHYFILLEWGTFQVINQHKQVILHCAAFAKDLTQCQGRYQQDQYGLEVVSFFGGLTQLKKNNVLIGNLHLQIPGRWKLKLMPAPNSLQIFYLKRALIKRQYIVSYHPKDPACIILDRDPHDRKIYRPAFTEHYNSNIPLADLYFALGFAMCKNKM